MAKRKSFAQAAWLRSCNITPPASLKKWALHFFNADCIGTEPADVTYATTGGRCEY
jgi:hypothetical protein